MESTDTRKGLLLFILYDQLQAPAFKNRLRDYGYDNVVICSKGEEALEKLSAGDFSAVVTDIELKGKLDGIETGKRIRDNFHVPLIYLTRLQDEKTFSRALETHPVAFLNKPVNWNELRMAIESAVYYRNEKKYADSVLDEFRHKFEEAPLPYQILDEGGNITAVNRRWIELMGYSADEVTGRWFGDFIKIGLKPKFRQHFESAGKESEAHGPEYTMVKKDGTMINIAFEGRAQYDRQGKLISTLCILCDITEEQKIRERLEESEERFRLLFEDAPLGYQSLAENGGVIYVNDTWCRLLGYSKDEVIGKWFGEFLAPEEKEMFKTNFSAFKQKGEAYSIEYKMIKKDGGEIYILIDGRVRYDENGNYIQSHCILKDITTQKYAEIELQRQQKELQIIIDAIPAFILYKDREGRIKYVNQALAEATGILKKEWMGKMVTELFAEHGKQYWKVDEEIISSGLPKMGVIETFETINGQIWLQTDKVPVRNEKGDVIGLATSSIDITGRKKVEDALRESEKKFRNLVESAGDIIYILDRDMKYIYGNNQYLKRRGLTREELIGKEYGNFHSDERKNEFKKEVMTVYKSGNPIHYEYQSEDDGKYFLRTLSPIIDPETKKFESITVISRDITGRKKIEKELFDSKQKLQIILDTIPIAVFWKDRYSVYLGANHTFLNAVGLNSQEELAGKNDYALPFDKKQADSYRRMDKRIMESGIPEFNIIEPGYRADSTYAWARTSKVPLRDAEGNVIGILGTFEDITERKKAEEKLRASEERYRGLADSITDVFFALDKDLKYTFWNKASETLTGVPEKNAIGKSLYEIFPDTQHIRKAERVYRNVLKDRKARTFVNDTTLGDKDFVFEISVYPAENGISVFVKDITERRRMEETLKESEERYRRIFEDCPIGIALTNKDFKFFSVNPSFCKMFGYTEEEMKNKTFLDITHPEQQDTDRKNVEKMMKGEIPLYRTEKRYISKSGNILWGNLSTTLIRAQDGKILYGFSMIEDITERKKIELQLHESKQMLQVILDTIPVAVFWKDRDSIYLGANRTFMNAIGLNSVEELIGKSDFELSWEKDQAKSFIEYDKRIIGSGIPEYDIIEPFTGADGTYSWARTSKVPLRDTEGNIIGVLGTYEDITMSKQAEEALRESEQKLKEAQTIGRIGSWEFDVDHKAIEWSDETYKLYERDLALGPPTPDEEASYYVSDQAAMLQEYARQAIETGAQFEYDLQARLPGGRTAFFSATMRPVRDESGGVVRLFGTVQDITDRKHAEIALKESEAMLRSILSAAPVGIGFVRNRIFEWVNDTFQKIVGFSEDELKGKSARMVYPDDKEYERVGRTQYEILKKHGVGSIETTIKHKNGNLINILASSAPVIPEDLNAGITFTALDITERKKAENEIREMSEDLTLLADINSLANAGADIETIAQELSEEIKRIYNCDGTGILLMDITSQSLILQNLPFNKEQIGKIESLLGQKLTGIKIKLSSDFMRQGVFITGKTRLLSSYNEICQAVRDNTESPLFHKHISGIVKLLGIKSMIIIPLMSENKPVGLIEISSKSFLGENTLRRLSDLSGNLANIITRSQAEIALKEREEMLRNINENMSDIIWRIDKNGIMTYLSPSVEKIFGYRPEEVLGQPILNFVVKEYHSAAIKDGKERAIQKGGKVKYYEYEMITRNNRKIPIEVSFSAIRDDKGNYTGFAGISRDISERKAADAALKESERKYRELFENLRDGLVFTGMEGDIVDCNKAYQDIVGYTMDELKSMAYQDITPEKWREYEEKIVRNRIIKKGYSGLYEKEYIRKNGDIFPAEISVNLIRDPEGFPAGMWGIVRDITDRKKSESALRKSEKKFRQLFETLTEGVVYQDHRGKIIDANLAAQQILGLTLDQMQERTSLDPRWKSIHEDGSDFPGETHPAMIALKTGKVIKNTVMGVYNPKIDDIRWISIDARPLFREGEKMPFQVYTNFRDITERIIATRTLKESEARYKDLVEKAGVAIAVDDVNGKLGYVNKEFSNIFGYTTKELDTIPFRDLIHPDDFERVNSIHQRRFRGERVPTRYEFRGVKKNGSSIWIEIKVTKLQSENKLVGTRGYLWDISRRKEAEKALTNSETRFRELFSHMSSGVAIYEYVQDRDEFVFRDMNEAGFRITQITDKEKIIGRDILAVFPGVKSMGLTNIMMKVFKSGRPGRLSASYYKDDRIELYVDIHVYKLPTGEIVTVFDDITERIIAEQNIWRNYEEIKKLTRHIETVREEERKMIARDLHDDLGQILTALKMDLSWIRNKIPVEKTGIKKKSESAIQIIDQAIQGTRRISSELRPAILDDLGLFETLRSHIRDYENRTKIKVVSKFPKTEPEFKPGQEISVFRIIQEALTNTARHSGASEVVLQLKKKDNKLGILIRDNGTGISDEMVNSTDSFGLISMRERVLQWGGEIHVTGKQGIGTTIDAIIPLL